MHVIPAIDLIGGRCVRLRQGQFDAVTEYEVDPLQQAGASVAAGLSCVHLVDLDGCRAGKPVNSETLAALAAIPGIRLQTGGGIRDERSARACLDAGAHRVVVGSTAFREPETVARWIGDLGAARIVIAADVRIDNGTPRPLVEGWQADADRDFYATLDFFVGRGLRHLLCTEVSRDGMMAGPAVGLYRELCGRYPALRVQASGGVRDEADLETLRRAGAAAAIVGKSLLDGAMQLEGLSQWSPAA